MTTKEEERKELETAIYDAKAFLGGIYYEAKTNIHPEDFKAKARAMSDIKAAMKQIERLEIELKILEGTFGKH